MDELEIAAEDTIARTPKIIADTLGASADSTFHKRQLPPLSKDACPNFPPLTVRIEGLDSFATARKCIQRDPTIRGKVAVLNLASDEYRAGGWRETLCKTQVREVSHRHRLGRLRLNPPFPITGRGALLLFHSLHHPQGRILPLAEPRTGFRLRDILPGGRDLQRRLRSLLRRSPGR
jgi:hypothetical protein